MPCISYPCGAQKSASHKLTPNPSRPRENPSECAAPSTPCDSQVRMDVVVTKVAIYKEIVQQIPVLPHKAVAEVSKIGNLEERLVVVNHGWQSKAADGPKGG